jgi:meso-butanediol dehydrogenase / (S,S)-butanediol dehydrogenase / diacetyl reductase
LVQTKGLNEMSCDLLDGKVVLITGGGSGIGRECALAAACEGAQIAIADVDRQAAERTAAELSVRGIGIGCDVGDGAAVEHAIRRTIEEFGKLDAVHNNAGISSPSKPLHETTEAEWDRLQQVNLKSVYWTTRYALPHLIASRGCILNTASMVGVIGQAAHAAYVATKGAMVALTKAMALDYARFGIRVNAICPAGVWTPMLRQWASEQPDPAQITNYLDRIHALGYCPEGDVIADAAVFLLSEKARFITGCILPVSGGAELGYRL